MFARAMLTSDNLEHHINSRNPLKKDISVERGISSVRLHESPLSRGQWPFAARAATAVAATLAFPRASSCVFGSLVEIPLDV